MSWPFVDGATLREFFLWPVKHSEGAGRGCPIEDLPGGPPGRGRGTPRGILEGEE